MVRKFAGVFLGAVLVLSGLVASQSARAAQRPKGDAQRVHRQVGARLVLADHMDVSRPLRDIKPIPPDWYADLQDKDTHEVKRWPRHAAPLTREQLRLWTDAARQPSHLTTSAIAPQPMVSATAGFNFDGVGSNNGYTVSGAPPDTNGAVGATQYVQWVNTAFAVFNKSTGARVYGPANGNTLWSGFGGRCQTDNSGDPIVMYDQLANRWVMMQFAVSASPYYQCVAVSQTSDATGAYNRYAYSFGSNFNDYPKGGVWPDGYYVTYNIFANGSTFSGAEVCAMDRNTMLSGGAATQQCFTTSSAYGGLLPAYLDGQTQPPAGAPNYVLAFDDTNNNALLLWKFHVNWTTPSSSTFTGPTSIPVTAFTPACSGATCIPQSGTTQQLDSLADRMMYRLAYRNFGGYEALVTNHSVTSGGVSGVRWYEVRNPNGTPSVYQQSTFQPDTTYRWMGSIAQDQQGNMMLGYSASSSSIHPAVRVTGRLVGDALNTMQAETNAFSGPGSQTGSSLSRWGDYSAMTVDPVDDCTFWYTQEYEPANGAFNWATRIASYKFASCGGVATPDFTVATSPTSLTVTQGTSGTSTVTVGSLSGFTSAVSLSASGLPAGVTASFAPASVTPPSGGTANSTLTLTASSSATLGTASVTVTGTSGSTIHSAAMSLNVTAAGALTAAYDATLKAPNCSAIGSSCTSGTLLNGRAALGPEPNQPNTINSSCADGTAGTYHSDESIDAIKVSTSDGSLFAAGKTASIVATVYAYSATADTLDLYYSANASSPTWTLIGSYKPATTGVTTITASYTLPSGAAQAVRGNFRYNGAVGSCTTGTYDDHDDLVFAVGGGTPDTTPPTTSITAPAAGATVSGTTTVTASASDNVGVSKVEFYLDGALKATDTATPYTWAWDTTTAANGSHSLTTKAYDAAGNVTTSAAVGVTVSNTGAVTVFYDGAESASTTFTKTGTTTSTVWTRQASAPYAGTYRWKAGGSTGGNYGNSGDARLTTPALNLSGASSVTLSYAFKYSTEASYDFFQVRISTDGGTTWTNLRSNSGTSSGYSAWAPLANVNLNAYAGQTNVKVQFRLYSDGSVTAFGAAVDEVKIVKQ